MPPNVSGLGSSVSEPGQKSVLSLVHVNEQPLSAIAVKELSASKTGLGVHEVHHWIAE